MRSTGKLEKTTIEEVFNNTIEFYSQQIHSVTKESPINIERGNCDKEVISNRLWETNVKTVSKFKQNCECYIKEVSG